MSKGAARVSPVTRLRMLDPVFSLGELQSVCGLEYGLARLYATRWTEQGLIKRFGSGVYFNLIRDENAEKRLPEALGKLLNVPFVMVGGAAIHAAGWTTQRHQRIEIAVPVIRGSLTAPSTEGNIVLTPRYANWFRKLAASAEGHDVDGVPIASPEYALADALLASKRELLFKEGLPTKRSVFAPPPDEIDMGEFDEDALERVREAMFDLGAKLEEITEITASYEASVTDTSKGISF